jgi:hypothetical protein
MEEARGRDRFATHHGKFVAVKSENFEVNIGQWEVEDEMQRRDEA